MIQGERIAWRERSTLVLADEDDAIYEQLDKISFNFISGEEPLSNGRVHCCDDKWEVCCSTFSMWTCVRETRYGAGRLASRIPFGLELYSSPRWQPFAIHVRTPTRQRRKTSLPSLRVPSLASTSPRNPVRHRATTDARGATHHMPSSHKHVRSPHTPLLPWNHITYK